MQHLSPVADNLFFDTDFSMAMSMARHFVQKREMSLLVILDTVLRPFAVPITGKLELPDHCCL